MTTNSEPETPGAAGTPGELVGAFLFAVDAMRELQSAEAGIAAMQMSLLAAVVEKAEELTAGMSAGRGSVMDREMAIRTACAEIGAALRVSDRTIQARVSHAWGVVHEFPAVFEALRTGRVTAAHVAAIVKASDGVPAGELRERYEVAALERADVTTPARLTAVLPSVAQEIYATSLAERHQRARVLRRVEVRDLDDGMAELRATLPAVLAHGIHDRLTSMAKAVEAGAGAGAGAGVEVGAGFGDGAGADAGAHVGAGASVSPRDLRSRDEIRADAFCDLLLGGGPVATGDGMAAIRAQVQIIVPVLTAAGVTDSGALLAGRGPIDAESARRLIGAASGWDRVMTNPVTGSLVAVDRYRPSEDLRRTIRVRDEHCRFPGCRQTGLRCDIDHSHAAQDGGQTCAKNLALLCRYHHVMKHAAHWAITHLADGKLKWTSPSGRSYIDVPTPTLRFIPNEMPPDPGEESRSNSDFPPGDGLPPGDDLPADFPPQEPPVNGPRPFGTTPSGTPLEQDPPLW